MKTWIPAGTIVNAHGIKGDLKLNPARVLAGDLCKCKTFLINGTEVKPKNLRVHKNTLLFQLDGVEDMNSALSYKGKSVEFKRSEVKLAKDTYFDEDLIGCQVQDDQGDSVGVVSDVLQYPAQKILEVHGAKEYLIPFVASVFIRDVNLDENLITVHMLEGLETDEN